MTKTTRSLIEDEIRRLRRIGKDFSPVDISKKLDVTTKEVVGVLREQTDAYRKRKAHARRFSPTAIFSCTEPEYYPSVWGFRKVPA